MSGSLIAHDQSLVRSPEERRLIMNTWRGMAHFGGTGPTGATCRECAFWARRGDRLYSSKAHGAELLPGSCSRFKELIARSLGVPVTRSGRFPHSAPACSHFSRAAHPRPAFKAEAQA